MTAALPIPAVDRTKSLPVALTTFVGRARELEDLAPLLDASRLVTLTGAGGSGKTRLALALVDDRQRRLAGQRVIWVELAPVEDPDLVADAVAEAMGAAEAMRTPDAKSIARLLGDTPTLLVLDNCEHVVDRCAELVDAILRASGTVRVLATSREPLGVGGERSWLVPALSLPACGSPEAVLASESGRLFLERAREVAPDFDVTVENARAVAEVCRRLDGIPLAIELGAARVRLLTPEQIRARLDDAFQLLASSSRTAIPRHRTLRATMDWSHALLSEDARALLRRMAVFRGGATLDAVEAVGAGAPVPEGGVLETLARLVDRSLVAVREHRGSARYALLETVRQYAAERLDGSGEARETQGKHAAYFLATAVEADPHFRGAERQRWIEALLPDLDNFRDALGWTRRHDPVAHVRLVGALCWFWYSTRHWTEANQWTSEALALAEAAAPTRERAALLFASGALCALQARPDVARPRLEESAALSAALGDPSLEAYALTYLGMVHGQVGGQEGVEACTRAASWFDAHGDLYGHRLCRLLLGTMAIHRGDLDGALAENEEGIRLAERFGLPRELGISLQNTGMVHLHRDELDRAEERVRASLEQFSRDPSHFFIATSLDYLAEIRGRRGHVIDAARLLGAADTLRDMVGAVRFQINEARLALHLGAWREAAGTEAWHAAWADGRALAPDRLVEAIPARDAPTSEAGAAATLGGGPPDDPPTLRSELHVDLRVRALGRFEVSVDGEAWAAERWSWVKPREALVHLLLHREGVTRDQLGAALWADAPPSRLKNSFHVTLHHLRKSLGHPGWIVVEGDRYRVCPEISVWFDADAFESAARTARRPEELAAALRLWRGALLEEENPGPWIEPHRDRLARLLADTRMALAAAREAQGRTDEAAELYHEVVLLDELREDAHRGLMTAWASLGQRPRALRHYEGLVALLASELQAVPEGETVSLYEALRTADAGLTPG